MNTNNPKKYQKQPIRQRGAAPIIGVIIIVILVLIAVTFAYITITQKQGPVLQVETPKVTADDTLNQGKSNNELVIDRLIVEAGLKRDQDQATAANDTLADEALPVGDGVAASTTVESSRLSQLQTEYIAEADRRLKNLNDTLDLTDDLTSDQKTKTQKIIKDEITALTGLKAKTAAETTKDSFLADREALNVEYTNYLMSVTQVRLLRWANDQTILEEKVNVLGGKFQERLNDASNSGESIAAAQTQINSYQSNKTTAKEATAKALKAVAAVEPSSFNANKAVLKAYYDQLNSAHSELSKALASAKLIITEIKTYK